MEPSEKGVTMSSTAKSFTRKQANVIYRSIKEGKIEMSKEAVSAMYDNVEYIDVYDSATADMAMYGVKAIKAAVTCIIEGNYETAQKIINDFEEIAA